jgi:hypothetical protein
MTAHELARQLLDGPDEPVIVAADMSQVDRATLPGTLCREVGNVHERHGKVWIFCP